MKKQASPQADFIVSSIISTGAGIVSIVLGLLVADKPSGQNVSLGLLVVGVLTIALGIPVAYVIMNHELKKEAAKGT